MVQPMAAPMADAPGALPLHEAAARHGACCWVERRLFALTGAWAAAPGPADEARVRLFEWSSEHAWHAQLWADRLPVLADVDREGLVQPQRDALVAAFELLEPGAGAGAAAGFLAALARVVLPGLLAAYRELGDRLAPVADGPAARALTFVVRDERDELAAVAGLADAAAIASAHGRDEAEAVVSQLQAITGGCGPEAPLFAWSHG